MVYMGLSSTVIHSSVMGKSIVIFFFFFKKKMMSPRRASWLRFLLHYRFSTLTIFTLICLGLVWFMQSPDTRHSLFTTLQSLSSPHCKQAQPGKPLIQYAIMLDAGSTGSRIH